MKKLRLNITSICCVFGVPVRLSHNHGNNMHVTVLFFNRLYSKMVEVSQTSQTHLHLKLQTQKTIVFSNGSIKTFSDRSESMISTIFQLENEQTHWGKPWDLCKDIKKWYNMRPLKMDIYWNNWKLWWQLFN